MDGEIIQQRSSYQKGLVLGLTMAEIMLLLIFCLLIAMAAFLRQEQTKFVKAQNELTGVKEQLAQQILKSDRDRSLVSSLQQNSDVAEKLKSLSGLTDPKEIDQYWRELVDSRTAIVELEKNGISTKDIRDRIGDVATLRSNGIDVEKAIRDADIVGAITQAMAKPGQPPVSKAGILDALARGLGGPEVNGQQWPPIITMSEAGGFFFKSGSAELTPIFQNTLSTKTPTAILENMKKFNVDVIEVVGHTDEQPLGIRQSNLDRDLLSVLKNTTNVASLIPADNAGLGLARAVSVVSVLRQSPILAGYKLIPLYGAQLVNTDETLAILGTPGDIPQRRRIEIRLRKSVPREVALTVLPAPIAPPKARPAAKRPPVPLVLTPAAPQAPIPAPAPTPSLFSFPWTRP